jgi:hypothetical protein
MIKYRTEGTAFRVKAQITSVKVDRETETSIWIKGRRSNKVSQYEIYHDTWGDAHFHLLKEAGRHEQYALKKLEEANGCLGKVKAMEKPKETPC